MFRPETGDDPYALDYQYAGWNPRAALSNPNFVGAGAQANPAFDPNAATPTTAGPIMDPTPGGTTVQDPAAAGGDGTTTPQSLDWRTLDWSSPWLQQYAGSFTAPTYDVGSAPGFNAPQFKAPTAADVLADSSYQFRLNQGTQTVQQAKAAQGTLNSGATAKALMDYGQNFASQEYGNVWNRAMDQYKNATMPAAQASYQPGFATWQAGVGAAKDNAQSDWAAQLAKYGSWKDWQDASWNKVSGTSQ